MKEEKQWCIPASLTCCRLLYAAEMLSPSEINVPRQSWRGVEDKPEGSNVEYALEVNQALCAVYNISCIFICFEITCFLNFCIVATSMNKVVAIWDGLFYWFTSPSFVNNQTTHHRNNWCLFCVKSFALDHPQEMKCHNNSHLWITLWQLPSFIGKSWLTLVQDLSAG